MMMLKWILKMFLDSILITDYIFITLFTKLEFFFNLLLCLPVFIHMPLVQTDISLNNWGFNRLEDPWFIIWIKENCVCGMIKSSQDIIYADSSLLFQASTGTFKQVRLGAICRMCRVELYDRILIPFYKSVAKIQTDWELCWTRNVLLKLLKILMVWCN